MAISGVKSITPRTRVETFAIVLAQGVKSKTKAFAEELFDAYAHSLPADG